MFVFGMLANAARHEPEAIAALRHHGQGRLARAAAAAAARALPAGRPTRRRPEVCGEPCSRAHEAPMNVVVAGGGSAGHIEPALALADAVLRLDPTPASPRWAPNAAWTPRSSRRAATPSS